MSLSSTSHAPSDLSLMARGRSMDKGLEAIRNHLGMQVAYISEFSGANSIFRAVDAPGFEGVIKPGDSQPLDDIFCRHILAGRLPELMPDVSQEPLAMSLPIMQRVPIGSHVSVPIRMPDGETYGMFCCLSLKADQSLNARDLQVMRVFADMAAAEIVEERKQAQAEREKAARIRDLILVEAFEPFFQPIVDLLSGNPVGFECLTRFTAEPRRTPDLWFNEAQTCEMGLALEIATIRKALGASRSLPQELYISVNASPQLVISGQLPAILAAYPKRRVVVEITEHARVEDYAVLNSALKVLRKRGYEIAVDDAGSGYSSLQHIVQIAPDIIKLDIGLIRGVDEDQARRALISALIYFARETGCTMIAEGIETEAERQSLKLLGVGKGQGYLFCKPLSLADITQFLRSSARAVA
ncbi:Rtn c-di-GMP phosphodiesterase class I (EAL domain) [Rhabdaerophilaceae bacterium]